MDESALEALQQATDSRDGARPPYLRLQQVVIFVRELERSLRFYLDQLGFSLAYDARFPSGDRYAAVAPPDGHALIALVVPTQPDEISRIGSPSPVAFITDDVFAKYQEWSARGVRFHGPPHTPRWGGLFAMFDDIDGNSFGLVGIDDLTRQIDEQRRTAAEQQEAARRAAQELAIAQQVQARLFPQTQPAMKTLDYSGVCIQARQVGGDYYDFLSLGSERLGLVVGDISGKGIAAALLMANLQANLRSQFALAASEAERFLRSVNQVFYENTTDSAYATLFFAEYDDRTQRLRYANCGHLDGLLLRSDGRIERLESTGTVLGMFPQWECTVEERQLSLGDVLVLYTDGVTESCNSAGMEFGEERLVEALRRHRKLPSPGLLATLVDELRQFSPQEQGDDVTVVIAKCTGEPD